MRPQLIILQVKKGEELNISYIDTAQDLAARRDKLQESYLFTCDCVRCTREEAGEIDEVGDEEEEEGNEEGADEDGEADEEVLQQEDPDNL